MTNAEYQRDLRAKAKAEGKCGECRARPAAPGRTTCRVCIDKHLGRAKSNNAAGLCRCGSDPEAGLAACRRCLETAGKSARKRYAVRCADGACIECPEPALPGRRLCQVHLDSHRYRQLAYQRMTGRAAKACGNCGILGHNSRSCARYHELAIAWTGCAS